MSKSAAISGRSSFSAGEDFRVNVKVSDITFNGEDVDFSVAGRTVMGVVTGPRGEIFFEQELVKISEEGGWVFLLKPHETLSRCANEGPAALNLRITFDAPDLYIRRHVDMAIQLVK